MEKEHIRPPELEKFRITDEDDYDEQDEIEGAQIVVMKEGKHLSEEQVRQHLENKGDGVVTKVDGELQLLSTEMILEFLGMLFISILYSRRDHISR